MSNSKTEKEEDDPKYTWTYFARHKRTKQGYIGIHQYAEGAFFENGGTPKKVAREKALAFLQIDIRANNESTVERVHIRIAPKGGHPFEGTIVETYDRDGNPVDDDFPQVAPVALEYPRKSPGIHPELEHHDNKSWNAIFTEEGGLLFAGPYNHKDIYRAYGAVLYMEEPEEYENVDEAISYAESHYISLPAAARIAVLNSSDPDPPSPSTDWLDKDALPE